MKVLESAADLERFVAENGDCVVVFSTTHCPACMRLRRELENRAEIAGVPVAEAVLNRMPRRDAAVLAKRFGLAHVPTIVVFARGRRAAQRVGFAPIGKLEVWIGDVAGKREGGAEAER